ncbi:NAD(P)H-hydrate epimerase [Paramicrobacterium fandaimingii]|uniref:NAD(P)H-hydrate epimerase n=1 Tax=Paramicrobacterium fandaimingii TaxID=2708079 RepID=UPI0014225878|nr:NAD(P)H-hydrate epimerase [Microbacterium fandaimingii]
MKAYTAAQVREAELPLLEAGVPLMQRAAAALADEIVAVAHERQSGADAAAHRVLLVVGSGNNGGDALFAGATVAAHGVSVDIARTSERVHEEGLAAALDAGAVVVDADAIDANDYDVIVDAILGTGTSGSALRGTARKTVERMLSQLGERERPTIVACDLPSGIHPDTGEVADRRVLTADVTVTFGAAKIGMLLEPASRHVGRLVVAEIGLAGELERIDDDR